MVSTLVLALVPVFLIALVFRTAFLASLDAAVLVFSTLGSAVTLPILLSALRRDTAYVSSVHRCRGAAPRRVPPRCR